VRNFAIGPAPHLRSLDRRYGGGVAIERRELHFKGLAVFNGRIGWYFNAYELLDRVPWAQGVAGSNPVAPTKASQKFV